MNFIKTDNRFFQSLENYWLAFKSRQLWRPLIFIAVLFISSYLVPRFAIGNQLPRLIILPMVLLIVGGGATIILTRHPNLGFALFNRGKFSYPLHHWHWL